MKNSKQFKYGTNWSILIVCVLAVLIIFNLVFGMLVDRVPALKIDLTPEKYYELSDSTKDILKNLDSDIKIYYLKDSQYEAFNTLVTTTLERYRASSSGRLSFESIDPLKNPTLTQKYDKYNTGIASASAIVVNESKEDKFVVIDPSQWTTTLGDAIIEDRITSAILNVTVIAEQKIYIADGLGMETTYKFNEYLTNENYNLYSFNILTEEIPEDANLVIIHSPKADLTADAVERLDKYLDNAGRVMIFYDPGSSNEGASASLYPRLDAYLKEWGLERSPGMVLEEDSNKALNGPSMFLAEVNAEYKGASTVVEKNLNIIAVQTGRIGIASSAPDNVEIMPIITSSRKSYAATPDGLNNIQGPFNLAVAATKYLDSDKTAELTVFGSAQTFDSYIMSQSAANRDLLINSIATITGNDDAIVIRPKYSVDYSVAITEGTQMIIMVVITVLIPLACLVLGLIVWLRRRHL